MKKNFFKKLSFVMALAMMVSIIAPATSAFAATAPKLNATSKVLYVGGNPSKYDFNIANLAKGSTTVWSTSDAKIATVDKATGLVAGKTKGTATITAKVTPKTGKAVSLKASVQVRDFVHTAEVVAPKTDKFVAGTLYDFNATVVTFSGATSVSKSSSTLRYFVEDKDGKVVGADVATVDAGTGKVTFLKTGDYKVVLGAFNSKAVSSDVANAKRTFSADVTVVNDVKEVKQLSTTKFAVSFAAEPGTDLTKDTAAVSKIVAGKVVSSGNEKIKTLTVAGKVATIEMFVPFDTKTVYNFTYGDLKGSFTSASTNVADIKGLVFDNFTVFADAAHSFTGVNMLSKVHAVNADGVIILEGTDPAISSLLTFATSGEQTKVYVATPMAYVYEIGYAAPVSVEYKNYVYNETTGTFDPISYTAAATATGVNYDTSLNLSSFQVATSAPAGAAPTADTAWGASLTLAAKDPAVGIHTRYKANDPTTTSGLAATYTTDDSRFAFVSSDTDKLIISTDGKSMQAVAAGTVTILVEDTTASNKIITTFEVTIKSERKLGSVQLNTNNVSVGNNHDNGETATIKVTGKDTIGDSFTPVVTGISFANAPAGADTSKVSVLPGTAGSDQVLPIDITAKDASAGAYNVKLTVSYPASANHPTAESRDINVTVIVVEANGNVTGSLTPVRYALELGKNTVDFKSVAVASDGNVSIDVYGYNAAGKRVLKLTTAQYDVTWRKGSDAAVLAPSETGLTVITGAGTPNVLSLSTGYEYATYTFTATVSGSALNGLALGSYLGSQTLVITDTSAKSVAIDQLVVNAGSDLAAAKDAFNFTLNGASLDDNAYATITDVVAKAGDGTDPNAVAIGQSLFIASVKWQVADPNNGGVIKEYTFDVNRTITGK